MISFFDFFPGIYLIKKGKPAVGSLLLLCFLIALSILFIKFELYSRGIYSFGLYIILLVISPEEFINLFNIELIEFWIASLFLTLIVLLSGISSITIVRSEKYQTQLGKTNKNLTHIAWNEFKKRSVALSALGIAVLLYSIAFLAPFLAPFSPNVQHDLTVTAYQPPMKSFNVLVLKEPIRQNIPLRSEETLTAKIANQAIQTNHLLIHRGKTNKLVFVDSYELQNQHVTFQQGFRTKKLPYNALKGGEAFLHSKTTQAEFIDENTFLLGTDQYGRDILSRVIYGSRISLSIGFLVVFIAVTLGTILGVVSGYFGGTTDNLIMRFVDILIAFPGLFLILIIIATFGNSIYLIVITLSLTGWMGVSRLVRSQILTLKEQEFILAAKSLGLSNWRIIFKHLVPNTLTPVIVAATLRIGSIILTEAGLSFLGLGVQPPTASWGNIINEGRDNLLNHWWISTFPGLAIVLTVVCFNLIGDGARDALDPRMRD